MCFETVFRKFSTPGVDVCTCVCIFQKKQNKTLSQNIFSKHYFKPLLAVQAPQGVAEIVENFCTSRLLVHDRTPHTK